MGPRVIIFQNTVLLVILFLWPSSDALAQIGLGGVDAVLTVPSARVLPEGHISVGFGYIPKPYGVFLSPDHANLPYFATLGYLPFLEISLRATKALDRLDGSIGDRMISFRLQILKEQSKSPAITLGLHDASAVFRSKEWFHSLYLVATKSILIAEHWNLESTVGYGTDWIEARVHEFEGAFGGLSFGYGNMISMKAEFVDDQINYGLGVNLFGLISGNLVALDGKKLAFGFNISRSL